MIQDMPANKVSLYPPWKELVKIAVNWDYGSQHKHTEIATILDCIPQSAEYYSQVTRANKELVQHSKLLANILGHGYYIVNPDDYPEASQAQADKALRHIRAAEIISRYAPVELMTPDKRNIHDRHQQSVVSQRVMMEKEQRKSKRLLDQKTSKIMLRSENL